MLAGIYRSRLIFQTISWLLVLSLSVPAAAELSDQEKKQQVTRLYHEYQAEFPGVAEISPERAQNLMNGKNAPVFIDARESNEVDVSVLPGAITVPEFLQHIDRYKDSCLIAYCTIGYRSGVFAADMIDKGLVIHNLEGGILGWIHAGGNVLHDGKVVRRVHVYGKKWDLAPKQYETIQYSFFKQLF